MSIERSSTIPVLEAPQVAAPDDVGAGVTPAMRLQILSTEHWSLLATRSLAWNEVFARAGMQLSMLSGAIVALALVGQGSGFGDTFLLFGTAILPVVLFVGLGTFARLAASNYVEAMCVIGMNRIRAGYLEMAPDLERFFVSGVHDDLPGVARTMGLEPGSSGLIHIMAATPTLVGAVNSVVAGALAGFVLLLVRADVPVVLAAAAVVSAAAFVAHSQYARARALRLRTSHQPQFPGPGPG
jgi:hypothetical protein